MIRDFSILSKLGTRGSPRRGRLLHRLPGAPRGRRQRLRAQARQAPAAQRQRESQRAERGAHPGLAASPERHRLPRGLLRGQERLAVVRAPHQHRHGALRRRRPLPQGRRAQEARRLLQGGRHLERADPAAARPGRAARRPGAAPRPEGTAGSPRVRTSS